MTMLVFLAILATLALLIFALTMILNVLTFPRLSPEAPARDHPLVSILIPARNEAAVIGETVQRILAQDDHNFELIVLDDSSTDNTGAIAQQVAGDDPRFRLLQGGELPIGWGGKSYACHRLSQIARGDILIFTDADVRWAPSALRAILDQTQKTDCFTVWPTQITHTMPERLTVPLMAFVILGYLPIFAVHHAPFTVFAAANGQLMAWRREAYNAVGGHTIVANNVLDDVTLARAVKAHGYRLRMADGNRLIATRMYHNWREVRDGYAKNILAGYGSAVGLLLGTLFHWIILLLPVAMLFLPGLRLWGLSLYSLAVLLRALSASFTHQRLQDAPLMPVSALLMTVIAAQSFRWHFTGGPRWKGRTMHRHSQSVSQNPSTATQKDMTSWPHAPSSSSVPESGD